MMAARESSGRASDVSESDEDGEGGMDSEEEELPFFIILLEGHQTYSVYLATI